MDALWKDLAVAIRQFRRQPGYALAVVSTLALAIGANIAVFSVVNAVLFRALPFHAPERLVWILSVRTDNPAAPFSLPEFMDYQDRTRSLAGISAYANWRANLAGDHMTEGLQGARISANAFDVLGLSPVAGRLLRESDDRPDAPSPTFAFLNDKKHSTWLRSHKIRGKASLQHESVLHERYAYI